MFIERGSFYSPKLSRSAMYNMLLLRSLVRVAVPVL